MSDADELYAEIRRTGRLSLPADRRRVVPALRRRARRDGLQIAEYTARGRDSRRAVVQEPVAVTLHDPANPRYIVRPDAEETPRG